MIEEFVYSGSAEGNYVYFYEKGFVWRFKNENIKDSERPLVVMIHGGPHGAILN